MNSRYSTPRRANIKTTKRRDIVLVVFFAAAAAANGIVYLPRRGGKKSRPKCCRSFGLTRSSTLVCTGALVGHACAPETTPARVRRSRAHRTYEDDGNVVFVVVLGVAVPVPVIVRTCARRRRRRRKGSTRTHPPNGVRNRVATLLTRRRSARRVAADSRRSGRP